MPALAGNVINLEFVLTANLVIKELKKLGTPAKAKVMAGFFKTGNGQYGHGDVFLGVTVPEQRKLAKKFADLPFAEIKKLLQSKIHESRLTALLILVSQYKLGDARTRQTIARLYLTNRRGVNNWDLVDSSAPQILGAHLFKRNRKILYKLARSKNIWDRRIAILTTQAFIREHDFVDTLQLAEILLRDKHDLIHKAVGWMLREVGNRSRHALEKFLHKRAVNMPRTMLRYAIEKFPDKKRKLYLGMV